MLRLRLARVEQMPTLNVPGNALDPMASPSGAAVAWRDADGNVLARLGDGAVCVHRGDAFTWAADDALFIGDRKLRAIRRIHLRSGEAAHVAALPRGIESLAAAPDGRLAFASGAMVYVTGGMHPMMEGAAQTAAIPFWSAESELGVLMLFERSTELVVRGDALYKGPRAAPAVSPAFSPDGAMVAAFLDAGQLGIFDRTSGRRVEIGVHEFPHGHLRWSEPLAIEARLGAKSWRLCLEEVQAAAGRSKHVVALEKLAAIEAEMKRIGLWQDAPLLPDAYKFTAAFAMDTMAFPQWLQFIFVPRVREIAESEGAFPASSQVSVQAVREFDGYWEAGALQSLLSEFDQWINEGAPA